MNPLGLPRNVHLLTFKQLPDDRLPGAPRRYLVRLAHLFQVMTQQLVIYPLFPPLSCMTRFE